MREAGACAHAVREGLLREYPMEARASAGGQARSAASSTVDFNSRDAFQEGMNLRENFFPTPLMDERIPKPRSVSFPDDGKFPNSRFPVLIYSGLSIDSSSGDHAAAWLEAIFSRHGWYPDWRDGIFDFHHYHSTAHEALGIARGNAKITLGGPRGSEFAIRAGDVLVLPAGTGHCVLSHSADFLVVGAYPRGQTWDIMRGTAEERPSALLRIAAVPLPAADPVGGMLCELWQRP